MPAWIAAALGVPLLLAAAKLHGRQLRLEREQEGYHEVEFGGTNPPWVEALWRRDRIRFWVMVPIFALLGAVISWPDLGRALVAALLWAPSLAFVALGIVSGARARWPHAKGSLAWGALVAALALTTALAVR